MTRARGGLSVLLVGVLALLAGCGENPARPSVVTDRPTSPPKTSARYIQVPWDISVFFNISGGAILAGAQTASTVEHAAAGDNLTGTFVNTNGFGGTLSGVLTGSLEQGTFDGTLQTVTSNGCVAERRYSGPLTAEVLNWTPGPQVNECGGASPLASPIQAAAAPPNAQPPCTYDVSVSTSSFPGAGGNGTATVTSPAGCAWFASSTAPFITITAGASGTGGGTVQFTVAANTSSATRTGTIVVAGQTFTITQTGVAAPACTYRLTGNETDVPAAGGSGAVDVRTTTGCAWSAVSNAPWLTITSGSSGAGDGTINFTAAPNPDQSTRVGQITSQGLTFTVRQAGTCTYAVTANPTAFSSTGGTGSASITTTAACSWTAASNAPWVTFTGAASGSGPAAVAYSVAANTGAAREAILTIAGQTVTITQAGSCTFAVSPLAVTAPAGGGTATVAVTVSPAGCTPGTWTALSNSPFVTVNVPSGTGSGNVVLTVAANTTEAVRTGTVTIAGQTVTVTQPASATPVCNSQQVSGADTPETRTIELGRTSGTVDFTYDTQSIADRMVVTYQGQTLFDTGCVGTLGQRVQTMTYSGSSTTMSVQVIPNCAGGTGTFWTFTLSCPR